jgi:hypothetical protein
MVRIVGVSVLAGAALSAALEKKFPPDEPQKSRSSPALSTSFIFHFSQHSRLEKAKAGARPA